MKIKEAKRLKKGDLVVVQQRHRHYGGIVLEVESIEDTDECWCCRVNLKQPGFNGFRLSHIDTRYLERFESQ